MAKQYYRFGPSSWFLLVGSFFAVVTTNAFAAEASNEEMLRMMRALEARVESLEMKNKEYRAEAAEARLQAKTANEKLKLGPATTSRARDSFALAPEPRDLDRGWSGAYFGASAGGVSSRSRVTATEQYSSIFTGNAFPNNITGANMTDVSGPGHRGGGAVDLFAGWNFLVRDAFLVGGQIEATVSDVSFNSAGSRTYNYFDGAGPTGQTAIEDYRPQVSSRWMTSALLRAGYLVDNQTLLYGIGGWTLARFEARNLADNSFFQLEESFLASGWTAGAGIERKLDSHWSVRGEYRYTNFGSHNLNGQFNFGSSFGTQNYQRSAQFDQSMQVGRIGIAYAIGIPR